MTTTSKVGRRAFIKELSFFSVSTLVLPVQSCLGNPKSVRFGIATDSHYADRSAVGKRCYRDALEKMEEFVRVMNGSNVDFVLHLGDFKDEGPDKKEKDTLRFLEEIEGAYAKFQGPRFHCVGNHDVDSITKHQFLSTIENTGIPADKSYYSFDFGGYHFIVLDANYDAWGNSHFFKDGANWQDPNIPAEQLIWLKDDLKKHNLPTIIYCHHPLFHYHSKGYQYHVNNYEEVQEIIHAHNNCIAVFQGHVHEERFVKIKGVHYITQLAMVDYPGVENNSFSIVELSHNKLTIHGYKRSSSKEKL